MTTDLVTGARRSEQGTSVGVLSPCHPVTLSPPAVPLCRLDDIPTGLGRGFEVGGKPIAVFKSRTGRVFAVDGVCPHKNGPLADGMLVGESVVCPLHAYRFDGATGACDQPTVCSVATYPLEVRQGVIHLTVTPV